MIHFAIYQIEGIEIIGSNLKTVSIFVMIIFGFCDLESLTCIVKERFTKPISDSGEMEEIGL